MTKSRLSKKGLIGLGSVIILLIILFITPDELQSVNNKNQNIDFSSINNDQDIIDQAFLFSVIDTDVIIKDSEQNDFEKWLDENGIGFTEKFAIKTDVTLIDSNDNITTESNIFGINELPDTLSITDEQGNILDFGGSVQVTFDSITQDIPHSVTSWASVKFYLDDNLISDKKLWSSYQGKQQEPMSVLNSLIFETDPNNDVIQTEIDLIQSRLDIVDTATLDQLKEISNLLDIPFTNNEQMEIDLIELKHSKQRQLSIIDKFPISPSFSDREKQNFTFTFTDENLSDGIHTFRVVFNEIDARLDNKNFHWKGENIIYELRFNVDNNKITKESESGNGEKISVFKSDNRFIYTRTSDSLPISESNPSLITLPSSMKHTIKIFVNDELIKTINANTESFEFNFARDSQLRVTVDGQTVYDEKTPLSQVNHFISLDGKTTGVYRSWGSCFSVQGGTLQSNWTITGIDGDSVITSSIGYEDRYSEPHIGDYGEPYPC